MAKSSSSPMTGVAAEGVQLKAARLPLSFAPCNGHSRFLLCVLNDIVDMYVNEHAYNLWHICTAARSMHAVTRLCGVNPGLALVSKALTPNQALRGAIRAMVARRGCGLQPV